MRRSVIALGKVCTAFIHPGSFRNSSARHTSRQFALPSSKPQESSSLAAVKKLRNDYFALRHGQSKANVAGIIASDVNIASQYGLSDVGLSQAVAAGQCIVEYFETSCQDSSSQCKNGITILSSDLLRAQETANAVHEVIMSASIDVSLSYDVRLRERGFGTWDGGPDSHYDKVWQDDALDSGHTENGVESVDSVTERATALVCEYDAQLEDRMVICVAHGDVLQILQTAFSMRPGSEHRSMPHLETATLRPLSLH